MRKVQPRAQGDFTQFYLRQVAISEGCGCAELVIRRDEPRLGGESRRERRPLRRRVAQLWPWTKSSKETA